jgi:hypothetical protein
LNEHENKKIQRKKQEMKFANFKDIEKSIEIDV